MIRYFHQLKEEEFNYLLDLCPDMKCRELAELYPQPTWCGYPEAISPLGCWSLTGFLVTGEDYCKGCDCYEKMS